MRNKVPLLIAPAAYEPDVSFVVGEIMRDVKPSAARATMPYIAAAMLFAANPVTTDWSKLADDFAATMKDAFAQYMGAEHGTGRLS